MRIMGNRRTYLYCLRPWRVMGDVTTRLFLWLGGREGSQPVKLFHSLISKSLLLNEKFEIKSIVLFSSVSFFFTLCMVCFPKNSVGFSDPSNLIILMKKYARLNLTISYSGSHYFNHNITVVIKSKELCNASSSSHHPLFHVTRQKLFNWKRSSVSFRISVHLIDIIK